MKQIVRVMLAMECGPATSRDIAQETGMTLPAASSYLSLLCADGAIRVIGTTQLGPRGNRSNVYELARQKVGAA